MIKALCGILTEMWKLECNNDYDSDIGATLQRSCFYKHICGSSESEKTWEELGGEELALWPEFWALLPEACVRAGPWCVEQVERGGEFHLLRQQGMATCWVPAIRAGPAHEVCLTSKRIIQLFSLFDYGQSPDLPLPVNHNAFGQLAPAPGRNWYVVREPGLVWNA